MKWRSMWDHNNHVHHDVLRYLPSETRYDSNDHCCFGLVNARSLRNKCDQFLHFVMTENLDFCVIVESWLKNTDTVEIATLKPEGYDFINVERRERVGGGIGIFFKNTIAVTLIDSGEPLPFEFARYAIKIGTFMVDIIALYRPPYSAQHPVSIYTFVSEFADFANELFLTANRCLFMGDFNIQINRDLERSTIAFVDVLNTLSLNQLVIGPTHVSGNTLDLILIRESSDFSITNVRNDFFLSDHRFILATLSTCPVLVRKRVQFRRLNSIDHESFRASLSDDMEKILKLESLDDMVTAYNYHTKKVLDDHAPVVTKLITARPRCSMVR
ncbi:hypothetical protein HOLleu_15069 [Holothuria leucospilota]|uniref:Endonuclease/exonuclease/phosphatase domain-containing protein n=1 Tax=Holothuria leucospilota TaxID=206669 RepID=A0A9Q1C7F0_HOLLE|nr:hypothetical protein HOLleu_15069 [Holothuria leucospilota]